MPHRAESDPKAAPKAEAAETKERLLPIVLLHGYPLDHSMWFGVVAALGNGIRTIIPDLRGFGKAGEPHGEPSIEAMAEDVLEYLGREELDRVIVAGFSMGGYVALAMAELAPHIVGGLALINSQCFADTAETKAMRRDLIKRVRAEGAHVAATAAIPRMFAPVRAENPDYQAFVTDGVEKAGVAGICWALEAMARRPDRCSIVAEAEFPVLVIHTPDDRFIPLERAKEIVALRTDIHFVTIPGAGHASPIEAPDQVASNLRKFNEICSRAAPALAAQSTP